MSPALIIYMHIHHGNVRLDESLPGTVIARKKYECNLRYLDDTTLTAEIKEELKTTKIRGE